MIFIKCKYSPCAFICYLCFPSLIEFRPEKYVHSSLVNDIHSADDTGIRIQENKSDNKFKSLVFKV